MEVKITKKKKNLVCFDLKGANTATANAFRRAVISQVPVMAVDRVMFYDNSSVINDEVLAHRIGLIPLKTPEGYKFTEECECKGEGCSKCTALLSLNVKGPKTVYSKELKPSDPNVVPVHKNIPIVKLTKNQKIHFEASAVLGRGKNHVKWQGGLASYSIEDGNFKFFVESYGNLETKDLINSAFDLLIEKVDAFNDYVKNLNKDKNE